MRDDFKVIVIIFLVMGGFISIKGFQSNLEILDIVMVFVTFIAFLTSFAILTALVKNFMALISNILFKK